MHHTMSVENPEKKISLDKNSQARKMKPRKKHNLVDETNNQEGLTALNETIFTAATSPVLNDDEDEGSHLKRALINEGKCENDGPEIVKKKRRTEKNKHATSIVFNDYEDLKTDSLRKEELTEMLNEVDCGKLKKVKKVKSKKITSGVLKNDESNKGMKENRISGDDRQTSKKVYSDNTNSRVDDVSAMNPSIVYLISWKKNRSDWSFKKLRQIWLLKNMYDETKVQLCFVNN